MKLYKISKLHPLPSHYSGNAKVIILVLIVAVFGSWLLIQSPNNENETMSENLDGISTRFDLQ